jgi:hypothetical protein
MPAAKAAASFANGRQQQTFTKAALGRLGGLHEDASPENALDRGI